MNFLSLFKSKRVKHMPKRWHKKTRKYRHTKRVKHYGGGGCGCNMFGGSRR